MKIKFRHYSWMLPVILFTGLHTFAAYTSERPEFEKESEPYEMTPDQLDDSLRIDKYDLDLDSALHIDSESSIELVQPESLSRKDSPQKSESGGQELPHLLSVQHQPLSMKKNLQGNAEYTTTPLRQPVKKLKAPGKYDNDERIEFQFEDADLQNLIKQIEDLFDVTFITDDVLSPLIKGGKSPKGNKISFKTHRPLTRSQAWDIFITFLELADMAVVPGSQPNILRITSIVSARTSPIPSYLGVPAETLPDNDQLVRFLYFVENNTLETIKPIVDALRSSASAFLVLKDMNAFVLTDKAENIKSLMAIIKELDRASMPQSMSVLKLRRADAKEVKDLYDKVTQEDYQNVTARLFPARKQPSALYFPENLRIIAEPRTNSLILLGAQDAIKRVEDFVLKYVDVELGEESFSPLRVYPLKYADANTIAAMMSDIVKFGKGSVVGNVGGVRDGDKYIKSLAFFAEPGTNRLVIKGSEDDYLQVKDIIEKLDAPQPQVAIEVLILSVELLDRKSLGTQLRSKTSGGAANALLGNTVKFQTSGLNLGGVNGIITNPIGTGINRLLGNLMALVPGAPQGNTVVTFGSDVNGVWGIFDILQTITNTQVVSNPFLTATNMQKATVEVGETRRVVSSTVITAGPLPTTSQADSSAVLRVVVIPQINSDGMIVLDLEIDFNDFSNPNDNSNGNKDTRKIKTKAIVADKEVLALGGLIRNTTNTVLTKTPILGDIPVFGWLFKSKRKVENKDNLLILISTRILPPEAPNEYAGMTRDRVNDYYGTIDEMHNVVDNRDPIHKFFFTDKKNSSEQSIDNFIFEHKVTAPEGTFTQKTKRTRTKRRKQTAIEKEKKRDSFYKEKVVVNGEEKKVRPNQTKTPSSKAVSPEEMPASVAQPSRQVAAVPSQQKYGAGRKQSLITLLSDKEERVVA